MRPNNALQPGGGRIVWIDQLKGIAFFFVILGHLSLQGTVKSWVFSFHMPLFFFATGCTYNVEKILRTPFKAYFIKLFRRMLVPYVWMQLLSMLPRYVETSLIRHKETPAKTFLLGILVGDGQIVKMPSTPLYYILLLFVALLVFYLLVRLSQGDLKKLCLFCAALLPFSLLSPKVHVPWRLNVVPAAVVMILLGLLLMKAYRAHLPVLETMEPVRRWAAVFALFSVGGLLWYFNGRFGLFGNSYGKDFMCAMASAVCTCTALALVVMRLPKVRLLTFVGKNTLLYMGFHKPVLLLFEAIFPAWKEKQWFVVAVAVLCYFLLIPVVRVLERFAPFVLGKESLRDDEIAPIAEVLCVAGATFVPYLYFLNHFHGGVLRSGFLLAVLSVLLYAGAVFGVWFVCRRVLRFPFLPKKGSDK